MSYEVQLGWMNLTPCSKVDWVPTSIPGVSHPVVRTAEQRLYGYAIIDSENWRQEAEQSARECVLTAFAAAGGIGALTANPAAAAQAIVPAFLACFSTKFADIAISNIRLDTRSVCMW